MSEPSPSPSRNPKDFQPAELVGYFWIAFGLMVLGATVWVDETPYVPYARAVAANVLAGTIILGTGICCVIKGRRDRARQRENTSPQLISSTPGGLPQPQGPSHEPTKQEQAP